MARMDARRRNRALTQYEQIYRLRNAIIDIHKDPRDEVGKQNKAEKQKVASNGE